MAVGGCAAMHAIPGRPALPVFTLAMTSSSRGSAAAGAKGPAVGKGIHQRKGAGMVVV